MATERPPLTWSDSAAVTAAAISDRLPEEVVTCLRNARFLHLATCTANRPHVSLMNYTYLPSHPFQSSTLAPGPMIIMTSNPASKKTINLVQNPNVSLLVHDWVSSRPPNVGAAVRERSPAGGGRASSLANMLMQMNSAAVSSISATINGEATVLVTGTEEERWCKEQHLANNTFESSDSTSLFSTSPAQARTPGDGGRGSYIEDEDVRVVVVKIQDGRISDWKGGVKDWAISPNPVMMNSDIDGEEEMVNGVLEVS